MVVSFAPIIFRLLGIAPAAPATPAVPAKDKRKLPPPDDPRPD
jgi:hypothetical protein